MLWWGDLMTIQVQLDWLVKNTTILWVEKFDTQSVVAGSKVEIDRFFFDQCSPVSFSQVLEPLWQERFEKFGTLWDIERQKYRLLYDTMKSFFTSFIGLRLNKVASIEARDNVQEKLLQGDLAGSHLIQMYMSGKKALDLIDELHISYETDFGRRFRQTRNKLFEHNHNLDARYLPDLILEPSVWEVIDTSSQMTVYIHTANEREYEAFIDYYKDYYDLEQVFVSVVEGFS
jgi:hypothetical protein